MTGLVVGVDPWWKAQYVIPIGAAWQMVWLGWVAVAQGDYLRAATLAEQVTSLCRPEATCTVFPGKGLAVVEIQLCPCARQHGR